MAIFVLLSKMWVTAPFFAGNRMKLSKLKVDKAKPKDKRYRLSDGLGLYLLVSPNGSKLWQMRYRFNGKENVASIGPYNLIPLSEARKERDKLKLTLRSGSDPVTLKKDKTQENKNFELVAKEWFEIWKKDKTLGHAKNVMSRLQRDIFPVLGRKIVSTITRKDVRFTIQEIASRGAINLAGRALNMVNQILTYAADEEIIQVNPASDLKPSLIVGSKKTVNYKRIDESEIPDLIKKIEADEGKPLTRFALKMMMLTFVRTSELIHAKWSEIDWKKKEWKIPSERMKMGKEHIVPLANQTIELLQTIKEKTGDYEYIFAGERMNKAMSNNTMLGALKRMGYQGKMTGHGFRGLASTVLHEHGFEHLHIEKQLAHSSRDVVSSAYNHAQYLKQRHKMMQWWADFIDVNKLKIQK